MNTRTSPGTPKPRCSQGFPARAEGTFPGCRTGSHVSRKGTPRTAGSPRLLRAEALWILANAGLPETGPRPGHRAGSPRQGNRIVFSSTLGGSGTAFPATEYPGRLSESPSAPNANTKNLQGSRDRSGTVPVERALPEPDREFVRRGLLRQLLRQPPGCAQGAAFVTAMRVAPGLFPTAPCVSSQPKFAIRLGSQPDRSCNPDSWS